MAFSQSALQAELLSVFSSMTDGDNTVFSSGVSTALKNFVCSGTPVTTDAGAVPAGAFAGASTGGSITADSSGCEGILQEACEAMVDGSKDNDFLAGKIAEALQNLTDGAEVVTNVTGTATPPSSSPIPLSGTARGTIQCVTAPVEAGLKSCFSAMVDMTEGGDEYFASRLASLTFTCLTTGVVSTDGEGALQGSKGVGNAV